MKKLMVVTVIMLAVVSAAFGIEKASAQDDFAALGVTTASAPAFNLTVTAVDSYELVHTAKIVVGISDRATNGFDKKLDVPAFPNMGFYATVNNTIDDLVNTYETDVRNDRNARTIWKVTLHNRHAGSVNTLSWDAMALPADPAWTMKIAISATGKPSATLFRDMATIQTVTMTASDTAYIVLSQAVEVRPVSDIITTGETVTWTPNTDAPVTPALVGTTFMTIDKIAKPVENSISAAPNPFNAVTKITVAISKTSMVNIAVFDMNGKKVITLHNGSLDAGKYTVDWSAGNIETGIYFIKLTTDTVTCTAKAMFVK
jgi:hypothetical protein